MDKVKSAYEMAMERFSQREAVPREEIDRLDYLHSGKTMAATFLRESGYDLVTEINKHPEGWRGWISEGARETLVNNIQLPIDQLYADICQRAISGLTAITAKSEALEAILGQLKHLFDYYEQSSAQAYGQLKEAYRAKIMESVRKDGNRNIDEQAIEPERYAGFREEWAKTRLRLNEQYQNILSEQKNKLRHVLKETG